MSGLTRSLHERSSNPCGGIVLSPYRNSRQRKLAVALRLAHAIRRKTVASGNRQLPLAAIAQDLTANAATTYGHQREVRLLGLEPRAYGLKVRCSSQLSYSL